MTKIRVFKDDVVKEMARHGYSYGDMPDFIEIEGEVIDPCFGYVKHTYDWLSGACTKCGHKLPSEEKCTCGKTGVHAGSMEDHPEAIVNFIKEHAAPKEKIEKLPLIHQLCNCETKEEWQNHFTEIEGRINEDRNKINEIIKHLNHEN